MGLVRARLGRSNVRDERFATGVVILSRINVSVAFTFIVWWVSRAVQDRDK